MRAFSRYMAFAGTLLAVACGRSGNVTGNTPVVANNLVGTWVGPNPYTASPHIAYYLPLQHVVGDSIYGDCGGAAITTCPLRGRVTGDSLFYRWPQAEDATQVFRGTWSASEIHGVLSLECRAC